MEKYYMIIYLDQKDQDRRWRVPTGLTFADGINAVIKANPDGCKFLSFEDVTITGKHRKTLKTIHF